MSDQSDTELIFLALQGDTIAFGRLVLRYQPIAQYIANRMMGNEDLAQEVVQDAMLQAYLSLKNLRDPKCFKNWLYSIVLNVCRNNLRRRKIIPFSLETMIEELGTEPLSIDESSPDPQQIAEQKELYAELLKAIDTLSGSNRLATLLFYQEQLSLKEVADCLNISVGAVKGRLHKARRQLREQLLPHHYQIQSISLQEQKTMTNKTVVQTKREFCCSFCRKSREQVKFLIAGPPLGDAFIYICDECVDICNKIISREIPPLTEEEVDSLVDSSESSN